MCDTVDEEMNLWYFKRIRMCRDVCRQAQINTSLIKGEKKVTHYQSERCLIDFSQQRILLFHRMGWTDGFIPALITTDMEESLKSEKQHDTLPQGGKLLM